MIQTDSEDVKNSDIYSFLAKTLVEKSSSLAKYHRRDILYISKTFSELRGICEKKITIVRHIEVNILKQMLKNT